MDGRRFDRLTAALAARGSRRTALAAILAAAGAGTAGRVSRAASRYTFSSGCDRFILAAGDRRDTEFEHVDDDFGVQIKRKGKKSWEDLYIDDDGFINEDNGNRHAKPIEFDARVGDKLRIVARNAAPGGCGLDEIWLFCERGGDGKRLLKRYTCSGSEADRTGVFLDETFRIKP